METYIMQYNQEHHKGVYGLSLVVDPAIEEYLIEMAKEYDVQLKEVDTEKRLFMTPVLIPDQKILRVGKDGTAFNIVFQKDVIQKAQQNFQKKGLQNSSTLEHDINVQLEGVTFVESWIKEDDIHDKSLMKGFKHPIGTWFTIVRVDNDDVLAKIKSGEIKGVSIDGAFELNSNIKLSTIMNTEEEKKSFFAELKSAIVEALTPAKKVEVALSSQMTTDEKEVFFNGEIAKDTAMFLDAEMTMPIADGTLKFEKMEITLVDGIVTEVKAIEDPIAEVQMSTAEDTLAKVMELLSSYSVEMAKAVAVQLESFKTEMKKEVVEIEVPLTKAIPNHEVKEPKTARERMLNKMQNN